MSVVGGRRAGVDVDTAGLVSWEGKGRDISGVGAIFPALRDDESLSRRFLIRKEIVGVERSARGKTAEVFLRSDDKATPTPTAEARTTASVSVT